MVDLYQAAPESGEVHYLATLDGATAELETRYAGTRPYLAGEIRTRPHHIRRLMETIEHGVHWVTVDGTYLRVHALQIDLDVVGWIGVDQSTFAKKWTPAGIAITDLRVVEPSPPRPTEEWMPAEIARAIRDRQAEKDLAVAVNEVFAHPTTGDGS
ncbi:hypothetical protein IU459_11930 [Nocardia amamiensis]|uniref:Uncharacterized protein n=1 Tax=Nocardia amamiensis TaxID=404578 RepID=A0ABS0CQ33_9NOCA|nr:hypothetical protein [Nocardia amamiensis]MBF6298250.1 hypothetical protein [Nocardia amamiensis]